MLPILLCLVAVLLFENGQCSQQLTLKSTLGEQALDLNCSLHNVHSANISHIISLVISKSVANQNEVLASAISVGGANPITHHLDDAVVTSDLTWDGNSDSFLAIHWKRASRALDGNYTCTLNGLNHDNIPVTLVTMTTLSLDDTDPALIATPLVIEVGLTHSLSMNCSLLDPSLLHLTTMTLIELSYFHGGIEQVLASISPVSGPESKPGSGASHVTGFLGNQAQGSFLEATWQFPDVDNTGQYVCDVMGVNSTGQPVLFRRMVNVTAKDPPREDLINKIITLQSQYTKVVEDKKSLEENFNLKTQQLQEFNKTNLQRIAVLEDRYKRAVENITVLTELYQNATATTQQVMKDMLESNCSMGDDFTCNFDTVLCGFTNDPKADLNWTRTSGSTPSSNTGPASDHTTTKGFYMYVEASNARAGQAARLIRDFQAYTVLQQGCVSFWYHMYGSSIGTLNVYIGENGKKKLSFTETGNTGNRWLQGKITLTISSQPFSIIFEAIEGNSYEGDIAIDDISIENGRVCS